ncbi:probable cytosolic oligopeptidase A [Contarinia nasturtii]|uniref:probable cytosolic oligopeptidase A n=1 Tax=Contarinia nasturtii TaxID=265458 RepID=UPI0012D3808E|nr:probable cytosolic oligopeptidase A [Contarinia nasturtii]
MGLISLLRNGNLLNQIHRQIRPLAARSYSGYVVLLPEIGDDDPKLNPFINEHGFPEFGNISIDRCIRRIGAQAMALEAEVKKGEEYLQQLNASGKPITLKEFFDNVLHPIETIDKELLASWGLAKTAFNGNNVIFPIKNYVSLHQRARRANNSKYHSRPIYEAIKELRKSNEELTMEQKRLFDLYVLEGKLCGIEITDENIRGELEYRQLKLSEELVTYESKTYVAIDHFAHTIRDYTLVQSFPPELLQAIAEDSNNPMNGPWKITLKPHILKNFLAYCPDREQRWNVWQANCKKASRQVVTELDNSGHLEWARDHRKRIQEILGYQSHAEVRRDRNLLNGVEKPQKILDELRSHAKPSQFKEINDLSDFAIQSGFKSHQIEEYDIPYWLRKYNITVCKYDENLIQEYFPIDKVFSGLFGLAEKLFGVKIVERNDESISLWHKSVKYFDVFDMKKSNLRTDSSKPIGGFFLDTCRSSDEQFVYDEPNGFVIPIREHCSRTNDTPLVSLIYNFTPPLYGKPHTFKLSEVELIFSRFANVLQKILNERNYRELSGLLNIEYVNDRVCSDVFNNLLYRSDVLKSISEHISTKEPLTDQHIKAIQDQRLALAGYKLSTELFRSAIDLEIYSTQEFWLELMRRIYAKYFIFELDKRDSRLLSMLEVVVGNWSGCYFALVWSNVMAADICDAFGNVNICDDVEAAAKIGQRFRETFLTAGSNVDTLELFRDFRGRDPTYDTFITSLKLQKPKIK